MQSFVINIVFNQVLFEIHFNEYYAPTGTKYFVYARNRNRNSFSFSMEESAGVWRIVNAPKVDEIFVANVQKLSDAITEQRKNNK